MTKIFNYKKTVFISGVLTTLFTGTVWGSSTPSFDVEADVGVLQQCFRGEHGDPDKSGQYKGEARRYVNFDVTARCEEVHKSLLPLETDSPLGQRTFHGRTYEVADKAEVGPSVFTGLQAKGAKLFVRSSPLTFDPGYWALYELFVPVAPLAQDEMEKEGFNSHFFALYYRELKK